MHLNLMACIDLPSNGREIDWCISIVFGVQQSMQNTDKTHAYAYTNDVKSMHFVLSGRFQISFNLL